MQNILIKDKLFFYVSIIIIIVSTTKLLSIYFENNPTPYKEVFSFVFVFLIFTIIMLIIFITHMKKTIDNIDRSYKELKHKDEERLMPYEFALNNSVDAIYWFTLDAKFVYINDAACKMLGYKKEELIGQPLEKMDHNFNRKTAKEAMIKINNDMNWRLETTQTKKNGIVFPVEVSGHGFQYLNKNYICAFGRDITQRVKDKERIFKINTELKKSLDEKEILLKEVHHRVKNNMEIISSLLSMQLRRAKDNEVKYILKQSKSRINTMALVHEFLYLGQNLAHIELEGYIKKLIDDIKELYITQNTKLEVDLNIDHLIFSTNRCIQVGMLIHELAVNSFKYAFKEDRKNLLCIHINKLDDDIHMKIRDNGDGMEDIDNLYKNDSIGMQLIHSIVEDQLDGYIEFRNYFGLECNIYFTDEDDTKEDGVENEN